MFTDKFNFSGRINVSENDNPRGLYPHQSDAIKELTKSNKKDSLKTLLVIPTGGGKTFTSVYFVLKEMINKNKKVLWIAHRQELLNQTLNTARDSAYKDVVSNRESFSYRIISGSENHDRAVNIHKDDDFIIASKDSLNYNKEYLENWLKENEDNVCLIIDEAHHTVAKSYRNIIELVEKYSTKNCKIIGLTATPIRTAKNEQGLLGKIFEDEICYSVDLDTLIDRKILATPRIEEIKTNFELGRELTSDEIKNINIFHKLPENIATDLALNKNRNKGVVKHYIDNKDKYGKCLIFAVNVDNAIALNYLFNEKGVKSDFVVSTIRDEFGNNKTILDNEQKIIDFRKGKLDVLINVNILTEGTDIPDVQSVFLARPTKSEILMNQMVGRGLRGKSAGGTDEAHIVGFIDDWKDKISWVSPKNILSGGTFTEARVNKETLEKTLIPIKVIEEYAKFIDRTVEGLDLPYTSTIPLGSYSFRIFDEEIDTEKSCEVLLFDFLKSPYEEFINELEYIFEENKIDTKKDKINEEELDVLYNYVYEKMFDGYDLQIGFNENDIKDILTYYSLTGYAPSFIPFEGREDFNVEKLGYIILKEMYNRYQEDEFLTKKWNDDALGWKIYFNYREDIFRAEVGRAIGRILEKIRNNDIDLNRVSVEEFIEIVSPKPEIVVHNVEYEKLSLIQISKENKAYEKKLRDAVYEKYTDEKGYYVSASGNYKNKERRNFEIDHIKPISKGGLTTLDNLQLLTVGENRKKGTSY